MDKKIEFYNDIELHDYVHVEAIYGHIKGTVTFKTPFCLEITNTDAVLRIPMEGIIAINKNKAFEKLADRVTL